jgi:hypothetical protein
MVVKNKNKLTSELESIVAYSGMAVMLFATVIGMVDTSDREGHTMAITLQPSFAYANQNHDNVNQPVQQVQTNEQLRRSGKEEIAHAAASYGTLRRSHAISGRL